MISQGNSMAMFYMCMSDYELRTAIEAGGPQTGILKLMQSQGTSNYNALTAGQEDGTLTSDEVNQYYASTKSPQMILEAMKDGNVSLKEFVGIEKAVLTERKMLNQFRRGEEGAETRPKPPTPHHPQHHRHSPQLMKA
jgi:hypothetical protein